MTKGRIEAFSDGVLAIIITIMVLELKVPEGSDFEVLKPLFPKFISYIISFVYVGIYWNNHHHLFQAIKRVNGNIMWANHFLLFCLSLVPFSTGWMGENHFDKDPVALYGINLFLCAIAFTVVEKVAIHFEGQDSVLAKAVKNNLKENLSLLFYIVGIAFSFFYPLVGLAFFAVVAIMWLIPDKRIEKNLNE